MEIPRPGVLPGGGDSARRRGLAQRASVFRFPQRATGKAPVRRAIARENVVDVVTLEDGTVFIRDKDNRDREVILREGIRACIGRQE